MSEDTAKQEAPSCPNCGAEWVESGPKYAIDGDLSHKSGPEAADEYYQNPSDYDDTGVIEFECGTIIPSSEAPDSS